MTSIGGRGSWLFRCVTMAVCCGALALAAQEPRSPSQRLQDASRLLETKGDYAGAIAVLQEVAKGPDRAAAAQALLLLGDAYEKIGRDGARQVYEEVVRTYATDQPAATSEARARLQRLMTSTRRASATGPMVMQITANQYRIIGPLSRDGQWLPAHESGSVGLLNAFTGAFRAVVPRGSAPEDSDPESAALSPDGSRLALSRTTYQAPNSEIGEITIVDAGGSGRRSILTEQGTSLVVVGWMPDGRSLVAARSPAGGGVDVLLVAVETGAVSVLTHLAEFPDRFSLSLDGRRVAYDVRTRAGQPERDIAVLDIETRRQRIVVDHPSHDTWAVWHPDSRRLVFASDRTGAPGLWQVTVGERVTNGEPSIVHENLGHVQTVAVSAAGAVYYSQWIGGPDVYVSSRDRVTGGWSEPARVARRIVRNNYFSAWSADSRWLALTSRRGGYRQFDPGTHVLVLHDMTTHQEREIVPKVPAGLSWPSWSPDGRSVAVVSNFRRGLYRVDISSGVTTPLIERASDGDVLFSRPRWTPDGRTLLYEASTVEARLFDVESKQERAVYAPPAGRTFFMAVPSPDGRFVAVGEIATSDQADPKAPPAPRARSIRVRIVPIDGGDPRTVPTERLERIQIVGWAPDGLSLILAKLTNAGPSSLWKLPVAGGALEPMGLAIRMEGVRDMQLSPDGQHVSFTAGYDSLATKVLENALPAAPPVKR